MKKLNSIICCFTPIGFVDTAIAGDFQTKVIHIAYGDTIVVLNENKLTVLRLYNLTSNSVSFNWRRTVPHACPNAGRSRPAETHTVDTPCEYVATALTFSVKQDG
jgi:hypothetical protein